MLELGLPVNSFDSGNSTTFFNTDFETPRGPGRFSFWIWKWEGLLLVLRDPSVGGEMQLAGDSLALNETLKNRLPMISSLEELNESLRPAFRVAQFRGTEGRTLIHSHFSIPVSELVGASPDSLPSEAMLSEITLQDADQRMSTEAERTRMIRAGPATGIQRSRRFVEAIAAEVDPGAYQLSAFVSHRASQRFGSIGPVPLDVRDYSGNELALSDLVLASADTLGEPEEHLLDEGLSYLPQPAGVCDIDRPFQIYFEVYQVSRDIDGISDYDITYEIFPQSDYDRRPRTIQSSVAALLGISRGEPVVSLSFDYRGRRADNTHRPNLSLEEYPEGPYRLRVTVKDNLRDLEISREITLLALHPQPSDR